MNYWHTRTGLEVDFVLYGDCGFYAIEVKNNEKIRKKDLRGLESFMTDAAVVPTADGNITSFALDPDANTLYFARAGVHNTIFQAPSMDKTEGSTLRTIYPVLDLGLAATDSIQAIGPDMFFSAETGSLFFIGKYWVTDTGTAYDFVGRYYIDNDTVGKINDTLSENGEYKNLAGVDGGNYFFVYYVDNTGNKVINKYGTDGTLSNSSNDLQPMSVVDLSYDTVNNVLYMARQDSANGYIYRVDTLEGINYNETQLRQDPTITSIAVALPPQ